MADPKEGQVANVPYRIDDTDMWTIIAMAMVLDIVSIVPVANDVCVFIAQPLLYFAFKSKGVDPLGPKNWVWFLVGWVIELIPGISIIPALILESGRWIAISRVEDTIKHKLKVDVDSEKAKAFARRALEQRKVQEMAKNAEKGAVANAARRPDGSFDRDKIREKRGQIADSRAGLNQALAPNPNAGRPSLAGTAQKALPTQRPKTRPGEEPANDNAPDLEEAA